MNKKETLLYKASRDGLSKEILWDKCQNHNETITLVKTDLNTVIGFYCPDKWVDTTGKIDTYGAVNFKGIFGGKPFIFYCLDGKIEIIKHRADKAPSMRSNS